MIDDPIDFICQCLPFLSDFIVISDSFIDIPTLPCQGVNTKPPMGKGIEKLPMRRKDISYNFSQDFFFIYFSAILNQGVDFESSPNQKMFLKIHILAYLSPENPKKVMISH